MSTLTKTLNRKHFMPPPTLLYKQNGAVLVIGLIILGISLALVTVGTHSIITLEKMSANAQHRSQANYAAESVVIQAMNDQAAISSLLQEARKLGQSDKQMLPITLPSATQTGEAEISISTRPTFGFSVDTLITYNITVQANATSRSTDGNVKQTFMRFGAKQ